MFVLNKTPGKDFIIICNEEGKLLDLEPCQWIPDLTDMVVGEIIVIGTAGEELDDLALDFGEWKELVKSWDADFENFVGGGE